MILSFAYTVDELLAGKKTVTRRRWSTNHANLIQKMYDDGRHVHDAYDKNPRNKGKKIGRIKLTERPYWQKLAHMPSSDLEAEGGMCSTIREFCELIKGTPDEEVLVIRFKLL